MYNLKPLKDPLGNKIRFPLELNVSQRSYSEIMRVITEPTFLIKEKKKKKMYFFRLINVNINLLVEVQTGGRTFVIKSCVENPSVEYIATLLRKGSLSSF